MMSPEAECMTTACAILTVLLIDLFGVARFPEEHRLAAKAKIAENPHRPSLEPGNRNGRFGRLQWRRIRTRRPESTGSST